MSVNIRKVITHIGLLGCMYFSAVPSSFAELQPEGGIVSGGEMAGGGLARLEKYLLTLGNFLGYDLRTPTSQLPVPNNHLIENITTMLSNQQITLMKYWGAFLTQQIVASTNKFSSINCEADVIFPDSNTNLGCQKPLSALSEVGVSTGGSSSVGQKPAQTHPIKKILSATLSTPDISFCTLVANDCTNSAVSGTQESPSRKSLLDKCCSAHPHFQSAVAIRAVGSLPPPKELYADPQDKVLEQLNGSLLIDPLLYSQTSLQNTNAGNGAETSQEGLKANDQSEEARNYITYATGALAPTKQIDLTTYQNFYDKANQTTDMAAAVSAQSILGSYLSGLRTAAAQNSVAISNLYAIYARRMPQAGAADNASQALNEYRLATRRLFDPTSKSAQWVESINNASAATVQKEIAILLSEINYQLYLTRQQEERLLLTNSIMLLQLGHLVAPTPPTANE